MVWLNPFTKTVLDEFYRVAFRKKVYSSIEELQADLDEWITSYNAARRHQGRWCFGKTPMQAFLDTVPLAKEKLSLPEHIGQLKPDHYLVIKCQIKYKILQ
jgi:hypothetical protein